VPTGNGYFVQGFGPADALGKILKFEVYFYTLPRSLCFSLNFVLNVDVLEAFENGALTIFPSADELDFEDPKSHPIPMPLIVPLIQAIELDQIKSPNNFFVRTHSKYCLSKTFES